MVTLILVFQRMNMQVCVCVCVFTCVNVPQEQWEVYIIWRNSEANKYQVKQPTRHLFKQNTDYLAIYLIPKVFLKNFYIFFISTHVWRLIISDLLATLLNLNTRVRIFTIQSECL